MSNEKLSNEVQNHTLRKGVVMPSLLAAGKLALAARLVTTANAKNLSQRIEQMEAALDAYDNEILSLSNEVQRSGAWRGWGIKRRDFLVKHKFSKYKTNFPLSLKPQSRQTAVMCRSYSSSSSSV